MLIEVLLVTNDNYVSDSPRLATTTHHDSPQLATTTWHCLNLRVCVCFDRLGRCDLAGMAGSIHVWLNHVV